MKKTIAVFITLCLCIGLYACSNHDAELTEVKSYLLNHNWYYYAGGTYSMEYVYSFNNDGTYDNYILHSLSALDSHYTGTYKIDTKQDTITFTTSDGNNFKFTYSLYENSLKLFNESYKEYKMIDK